MVTAVLAYTSLPAYPAFHLLKPRRQGGRETSIGAILFIFLSSTIILPPAFLVSSNEPAAQRSTTCLATRRTKRHQMGDPFLRHLSRTIRRYPPCGSADTFATHVFFPNADAAICA
jgi:hypothetical protein